jgi:hypothetical protein
MTESDRRKWIVYTRANVTTAGAPALSGPLIEVEADEWSVNERWLQFHNLETEGSGKKRVKAAAFPEEVVLYVIEKEQRATALSAHLPTSALGTQEPEEVLEYN